MVFSEEDKILINKFVLHVVAGHSATKRYHKTTDSFYSHPHFTEENNYVFVCLNISDILVTHKYTQHTQLSA